jgi:hypothetical protein
MALVKPSGRIGLVLPSGFATDHGSGALRRRLLSECEVDALVGFDNHDRVFPIHRSVRFLLMTASRGRPTTALRLRLGERSPAVLESDGDDPSWFPITVAPSLLERLSGPGLAIPDLRSPSDLTIAEHAATRFLPFGDTRGWGASFGRELNATDDRAAIATAGAVKTGLRRRWLPVVEGKHLEPFRADLANVRFVIDAEQASRRLGVRHLRPRLAYRDVASATNRATLIAALLPAHTVSTHTLFCLRTPLGLSSQYFLSGILNSFVVNYLARMRVATHVTTAIVEWLPVPTLEDAAGESREIAALARLLAHWNDPPASARLNALVARLYGLSADEFAHILTTFPLVPVQERAAARSEFAKL